MKFKNNKYAQYIIDDYAENEIDIDDITVKRYLIDCAGSINECDHPNASLEEFEEILEEILGKKFLKKRSVEKMFTLNEKLLNFVVKTIEVKLIKFNALNNKFSEYYTSKLNNDYKRCYHFYYRSCIHEDGDYSDINKKYAILQQLVEFKKVIDFNN